MASNVRVGIDFILNQTAFKSQLDQAARMMRQTLSSVTVDTSGMLQGFERIRQASQRAGQQQKQTYTDAGEAARRTIAAIAAEEKRLADIRAKYSADAYIKGRDSAKNRAKAEEDAVNAILADMKRMQDQRAVIQTTITKAEDAEVKKRLQAQNRALLDELRLTKQVALDKDAVSKGGAGGKIGALGTGRQIVGNQMGGDLGSLVGGKAAMASAGIGVALVAVKEGLSLFAQYETSLADLSAITGLAGEKLQQAGEDARELGKKYGIDGKDGVESMKLVISALGPEVAKNREVLKGMTDTVLTFAKAGSIDGQEAADALTITMTQFGYANADAATQMQVMTRIANVQAAASKEGAAEIGDLSASMKVAGATASGANMSIEQTAAAIEMLAPAGIKGGDAGTALRNVILSLSAGSKEAKKALEAMGRDTTTIGPQLKKMGLSFQDINPSKVGLTQALETLKKGFESIKDPVEKDAAMQKIFGKEMLNAAQIMIKSSGQLDAFTKKVTGTSTASEMAAIKMNTMQEGWNRFMVQIKDVALTIFTQLQPSLLSITKSLAPVVVKVAEAVAWVIKAYQSVSEWLDSLGLLGDVLRYIINPIGAIINLGTRFYNVMKDVVDWVRQAYSSFTSWKESVGPLGDAIGTLLNPIGALINGIQKAYRGLKDLFGLSNEGAAAPSAGPLNPNARLTPASSQALFNPGSILTNPVPGSMLVRPQSASPALPSSAALSSGGSGKSGGGTGGRRGGGSGRSAEQKAKEAFDKDYLAEEEKFNEELHKLSLARRNNQITEEQFAVRELESKIKLNASKLELAKKHNQATVSISREGELLLLDLRDAQYKRDKAALEASLTDKLALIEQNLLEGKLSDDQAKGERIRAEQAHNDKLIELAKAYNQAYLQEQRAALKLTVEVGKANLNEAVAAAVSARDIALDHIEELHEEGKIADEVYFASRKLALQSFVAEATAAMQEYGAETKEVHKEIAASDKELTKTNKDEDKKRKDSADKAKLTEEKRLQEIRDNNLAYQASYNVLTNTTGQALNWMDSRWKSSFKNQNTVLFQTLSVMTETTKGFLSKIASEYADKIAIIVGENLEAAGSYMVQAVGSLVSWQMSLGWWNLALIPAEITALYYMFDSAKKLFGFAKGGLVPDGEKIIRVNEEGQEFVMNAESVKRYRPLLEALNQSGLAGRPIPPELISSIHIGRFSSGEGWIPPQGSTVSLAGQGGVLPPDISRQVLVAGNMQSAADGFRSGSFRYTAAPQGGTLTLPPTLPISRRDSVTESVSLAQEIKALREEYRNRPQPIIMDQYQNILSIEREKRRSRESRL